VINFRKFTNVSEKSNYRVGDIHKNLFIEVFTFLPVVGLEFRVSYLLDRHSTT
jgi:hypothetical protein